MLIVRKGFAMETVDHWMKVEICWDGDGRCACKSFEGEEHVLQTPIVSPPSCVFVRLIYNF